MSTRVSTGIEQDDAATHAPAPRSYEGLHEPGPTDATHTALKRLVTAVLTFAILAATTYVIPGLERFRPWAPGDPPPLARLLEAYGQDLVLPSFASAPPSRGYRSSSQANDLIARDLGATVAANLGHIDESSFEESRRPQKGDHDAPFGVRIDPSEYADIEVLIEDPTGAGMRPFYQALLRTARREGRAMTRISHYGDSSIATDLITFTARRHLQRRFGDGGHGFILIARGVMPYRHRDVTHNASDDWELRQLVANQDPREEMYGFGGVQYRSSAGSWALFGTSNEGPVGQHVSSFEVYYQRHSRGGNMRLRVDRGEPRTIETRADTTSDAFERIEVPDGAHSLDLRHAGGGQLRLYGVALERSGPGVVYDSLGMVGARARRMLNFNQAHIEGQLAHRNVNLLVLGFGGNEASDTIDAARYEEEYIQVIRHMRKRREAMGCLVFAPLDQALRNDRGQIETMRNVPVIVQAQARAARREGCAFYNTFQAMGGEGAMRDWFRAEPRLAMADFRHATPAGYEVIANMFYKAMLRGFAEYIASQRH